MIAAVDNGIFITLTKRVDPEVLSSVDLDKLFPSCLDTLESYSTIKQLIESHLCIYQRLTNGGQRVVGKAYTRILFFNPLISTIIKNSILNEFKSHEKVKKPKLKRHSKMLWT